MAKQIRKLISFVTVVGIIAFSLSACNAPSFEERIDSGVLSFGEGKETEEIEIVDNEVVLDTLIDKYSGSYHNPQLQPLTDDEFDDMMAKFFPELVIPTAEPTPTATPGNSIPSLTDPDETDATTTVGTDDDDPGDTTQPEPVIPNGMLVYDVSSDADLERAFHQAYDQTAVELTINCIDGYSFNMDTEINEIYINLQREDPIDVSGVESWSWWQSGNTYNIFFNLNFDVDELIQMKADTETKANEIVSNLNLSGKSDYEIVYAINEYLCDTVYYPEQEPYEPVTHMAYGAFFNGCAVCEGYACAAKVLLSKCGVESDIEVGDCIGGGGHAWNLVKVDGDWYQLDICWNDVPGGQEIYFLVSDDFMHQSRVWDDNDYPVCPSDYK